MEKDKSKFQKALTAFLAEFNKKDEPLKFKDVKLTDGTIARYDGETPAVGMPFSIVTDAGVQPAPDGDYTLEDGSVISVVGGMISALKPAESAAPPAGATPPANDMGGSPMNAPAVKSLVESIVKETRFAIEKDFNEKIEAITKEKTDQATAFTTQKEANEKEVNEIKAVVEKQKTTIEAMFKLLEAFGETPSGTPADKTAKPFDVKAWKAEFRNDLEKTKN